MIDPQNYPMGVKKSVVSYHKAFFLSGKQLIIHNPNDLPFTNVHPCQFKCSKYISHSKIKTIHTKTTQHDLNIHKLNSTRVQYKKLKKTVSLVDSFNGKNQTQNPKMTRVRITKRFEN